MTIEIALIIITTSILTGLTFEAIRAIKARYELYREAKRIQALIDKLLSSDYNQFAGQDEVMKLLGSPADNMDIHFVDVDDDDKIIKFNDKKDKKDTKH